MKPVAFDGGEWRGWRRRIAEASVSDVIDETIFVSPRVLPVSIVVADVMASAGERLDGI
jgi:hypothetical protein